MANYLRRLYYWFLLGPVITLEWLRRKKKFCCVTGISQQVVEESTVGNAETEESPEQNIHDITGEGNEDESQPLIIIMDTNAASTRNDNVGRCRIVVSMTRIFGKVYNFMCTVCNFLFIIILNKHQVVTRYVFYISVCMICAYVESNIVAVFYFILNSQGALNNLKLTALRTVALGLTLSLSFSSSMHIIRKLMKPQESLFEGLSER
ncbi:uncharacterized protein LOC111327687 [Stylophora pistillata]|uniref:uncharacterized protein LOC111327687 n=1 Tax=Stylophora pistillata TaxID=50429 RepID=UPI000C04DBA2|nr:uncharacterized protein LOC111327687 [Stylophora pistillata]